MQCSSSNGGSITIPTNTTIAGNGVDAKNGVGVNVLLTLQRWYQDAGPFGSHASRSEITGQKKSLERLDVSSQHDSTLNWDSVLSDYDLEQIE
jgi:hypothetical protein